MTGSVDSGTVTLDPWAPAEQLGIIDPTRLRYSRGFLQCRPGQWFPDLGAQWLPLAHALGVEFRVLGVETTVVPPTESQGGFCGTIDGEALGVLFDRAAKRTVLDAIAPSQKEVIEEMTLRYLVMRILGSLQGAWSGPSSSEIRFDAQLDPQQIRSEGAVKLTVSLNGNACVVWFLLGPQLVGRLDALWRGQLQDAAQSNGDTELQIELASFAMNAEDIRHTVRSGARLDCNTVLSDRVLLRAQGSPWLMARALNHDGRFSFETLAEPVRPDVVEEGMMLLGGVLGAMKISAGDVAELSQPGALLETDIPLSPDLRLTVNGEIVGQAVAHMASNRLFFVIR